MASIGVNRSRSIPMTLSSATPLIALDAVVIDTETTSLDPRKAWIVEIAAVRLAGGRLDTKAPYRRLVRPGEPIPVEATRIHRIDDAAVADAPGFAGIWQQLSAYLGGAVMIGHTIGFDLAVLKRECERAGMAWTRPRTLDTRLLAEVAEPDLAGYSLDNLAAWLGVETADRHSALGDAVIAARVFLALLPKLRETGIRTLAEADRACRALTNVLEEQHRAGWIEPTAAPIRTSRDATRIDTYPYRHRIGEIMSAPAKSVPPGVPVGTALDRMVREGVSSLFVRPGGSERPLRPEETGIVTERDVMRLLAEHGADALSMPVERMASRPLVAIPAEAFAFLAMARMNRLKIRHLGVTDELGNVVGAISARDLLRLRAEGSIALGDEIEEAKDVHDLGRAWSKLPQVAAGLIADNLSGRQVAALISRRLGALTQRAAVLAERRMQEEGHGVPPCRYAFAVLGSGGRGECLLAMDQDNALVFADGAPGGAEDRWFEALAVHVADILHEAGVPYCKGGVMAKNPQWRGSLATWQARVDDWIRRSSPRDLLSVDIFFDLRGVHGDAGLANRLRDHAFDAAAGQAAFAKLLVESAGSIEPGLTFLRRFRTERGRIDLKKTGLFGIVTDARALAICHHVVERSTPERLAGIKALGIGGQRDLDALAEAHGIFLDLILAQQIEDIEHGTPASNSVAVKRLSQRDQARLRNALRAVGQLDALTRDLLFEQPGSL
jgi:CBS domain-containing protein